LLSSSFTSPASSSSHSYDSPSYNSDPLLNGLWPLLLDKEYTSQEVKSPSTGNAVRKLMESPHRKTDFLQRLPLGWREKIDPNDWQWIGQHLFASKGVFVCDLKNWWHPPHPPGPSSNLPSFGSYFYKRLFLWMPRKMWLFDFKCPCCARQHSLTSKGLYRRVSLVIDIKNRHYLAA
jgi:hypothetical protein